MLKQVQKQGPYYQFKKHNLALKIDLLYFVKDAFGELEHVVLLDMKILCDR